MRISHLFAEQSVVLQITVLQSCLARSTITRSRETAFGCFESSFESRIWLRLRRLRDGPSMLGAQRARDQHLELGRPEV